MTGSSSDAHDMKGLLKQSESRTTALERRRLSSRTVDQKLPLRLFSPAAPIEDADEAVEPGWRSLPEGSLNRPPVAGQISLETKTAGDPFSPTFFAHQTAYCHSSKTEYVRDLTHNPDGPGSWSSWAVRTTEPPERLGVIGKFITDWNNAVELGFYWGYTETLNKPAGIAGWTQGVVQPFGTGGNARITQTVQGGGTLATNTGTYQRVMTGTAWGPWVRLDSWDALSGKPDTLTPTKITTDWDLAVDPGFWAGWSEALNAPEALTLAGYVSRIGSNVVQHVARASSASVTEVSRSWQRRGVLASGAWTFSAWAEVNNWDMLRGKPTSFTPSAHTHSADDVTSGTLDAARIPVASETARGGVERATQAEVSAGTDTSRYVSPATLRGASFLPRSFASGRGSLTVGAGAGAEVTVTFPSSRFSVAPNVLVEMGPTSTYMGGRSGAVRSVSATQFVYGVSNTTTIEVTVPFMWMAIQMTTSAANG